MPSAEQSALLLLTLLFSAPIAAQDLSFREAPAARADQFAFDRRPQGIVAVELGPRGSREYFPLGAAVRHSSVRVLGDGRGFLILSGGVRRDLALHVKGPGERRITLRFPGSRLLRGFETAIAGSRGRVLGLVFRGRERVQVRVYALDRAGAKLLVSRELERSPRHFRLERVLGGPRILVSIGNCPCRAPGQTEFRVPSEAPSFLHPDAALPSVQPGVLDFGAVLEGQRRRVAFQLTNPGALPLPLVAVLPSVQGFEFRARPQSLVLAPGRTGTLTVEVHCQARRGELRSALRISDVGWKGDPLVTLPMLASAKAKADSSGPALDVSRIRLELAPRRKVRVVGRAGAVRDASPPIEIGIGGDARCVAKPDGSFVLEADRGLEGRVVLWASDSEGNRTRPRLIGRIRDLEAPVWDASKISLGLPVAGKVSIVGTKGAVKDQTGPIRIEIRVAGQRRGDLLTAGSDGSFRGRVSAKGGEDVALLARDGEGLPNRSSVLKLGRVLPFLERSRDAWHLTGPPRGRFLLLPARKRAKPLEDLVLHRYEGRLDARGRFQIPAKALLGADLLFVEVHCGAASGIQRLTQRF